MRRGEDDAFILEEEDASISVVRSLGNFFFVMMFPLFVIDEKKDKKADLDGVRGGRSTTRRTTPPRKPGYKAASLLTSAGVLSLILFLLYFH